MIKIKLLCRQIYLIFSIFLFKAHKACLKHHLAVTLIFMAMTVFMVTQVGKMKTVFSAEDLAGEGLASVDELRSIKERFRDGVTSTLLIKSRLSHQSFTVADLCTIRSWYSALRVSLPDLKMTVSTFDFKHPVRTDTNRIQYQNILSLNCKDLSIQDSLTAAQEKLNQTFFGLAQEKNQTPNLVFQFIFHDSETSKFGSFDPEVQKSVRNSFENELKPLLPHIEANWVGPADYQWYLLEGFKFSKWVNLSMLILMVLCLRLFLGTWQAGFLYCGTLIVSAIWVFGLKGLFGSTFDVLSTGLFLMMAISSLEDFVFVSGDMMRGFTWQTAMRRILVPGCFTSVTTIIGFLSSCVSDVAAISRLGFWAAMGGLIECTIIFLILPAFLKSVRYQGTWVKSNSRFHHLQRITGRLLPRVVAVLLCAVFPLGILVMGQFNYNDSPENLFPKGQAYRESLKELNSSKGWMSVVSVLFDEKLNYAESEKILQSIVNDSWVRTFVVTYESPGSIISWLESLNVLPKGDAKTHFKISNLREIYEDQDEKIRSLFYIKNSSVDDIRQLKEKVYQYCGGQCHLGGEPVAYSDFTNLIPRSLMESLLTSLVFVSLVIVFLALALDKEKNLHWILISCYWGPFCIILVLGTLHTTLDLWKSIFASILVGLAGDNAIQYIEGSRHKSLDKSILDRGASSILTAGLMAAVALCYLGSYFLSPREFGVILFLGLIASLVGELWLLNSLLTSNVNVAIEETSRGHEVTNSTGSS